jgi:hypothetical protein
MTCSLIFPSALTVCASVGRAGRAAFGRKVGEDSVEDTHAEPANEPIVERLVGAIDRGRIPPSQTIPGHMDYPADHTPVVHVRNATRPREKGFNALKLSLVSQN